MEKNIWQKFFDGHAPGYMDNVFVKNTEFEIQFIIKELRLAPGDRVLDLGCGTGRHCIPLARYGILMTGLDLSEGMLKQARELAGRENVRVELVQADATDFSFPEPFDHAICICEGSFGLLAPDDDAGERDLKILINIHDSLRPGGKLLITVLNGLKKVREHSAEDIASGIFDPVSLVTLEKMPVEIKGINKEVRLREKAFSPSELHHLFTRAGLKILELWGGTAGAWNKQPLDMDEYEIMVIAQKPL